MPQADREPAPVQVILDREDHRQRPDRQRQASHRHRSQQLPAPIRGNQFLRHAHVATDYEPRRDALRD